MEPLDVTTRFVLEFCRSFARDHPTARILDFGCGSGKLVAAARAAGIEMAGADIYYGGSQARAEAEASGLLRTVIIEVAGGRMGFPDCYFDLVVNNQVLEHVDDLDGVLREIHRVVKPGGQVLSIFPSRDVFREGHIGIPFAHWFPGPPGPLPDGRGSDSGTEPGPEGAPLGSGWYAYLGSRLRFYYTWALRSAGMGTWKQQAPSARQWAADKLEWIDRYTHYRSRREIFETFGRYFRSEMRESDYIRFRLLDRPGRKFIAEALRLPGAAAAARAVFRKLAFLVILSRKEAA